MHHNKRFARKAGSFIARQACGSNFPLDNITRLAQDEADEGMFLHVYVADAIQSGFRKVIVRTVDTDVQVLEVALLDKPQTLTKGSIHPWAAFGTGMKLRYSAAHDITRSFVIGNALALPAFHTITWCDTVSCFHGKGKKKTRAPGNVFLK